MIKSLFGNAPRAIAAGLAAVLVFCGAASAQVIGLPEPEQLDLPPAYTPGAESLNSLHHLMLIIAVIISAVVLALLLWVILRYNRAANKTPARFTHNTLIEVIWTVTPVIILIIIAVPSVKLLLDQEDRTQIVPDIVVKATGNQWYWTYEYPELGVGEYVSSMIGYDEPVLTAEVEAQLAEAGYTRDAWLYAVDYPMVVPVGQNVVVRVTAADVIHSWTVLGFGVKADGVPGKNNQTWFRVEEEGVYFGQCSEICGRGHSYMPITVIAVSQPEFDAWAACAQENGGDACPTPRMTDMIAARDAAVAAEADAEAPAIDTAQAESAPLDAEAGEER